MSNEPSSPNSSPNGKPKLNKQNSAAQIKSPRQQSIKLEVENNKMEIEVNKISNLIQHYGVLNEESS